MSRPRNPPPPSGPATPEAFAALPALVRLKGARKLIDSDASLGWWDRWTLLATAYAPTLPQDEEPLIAASTEGRG